jgi:hypothetical protein
VKFPSRFRALTNVPRYDGDTNPSVWLEDYRLACHAGGATDDLFVIKNLPLYLGDSTHMWLGHLPRDKINNWTDLRRVFVGNFQETYMRPGKQWELRNYKQQSRESLRKYMWCFSKRCTELPGATDNDAISTFQNGTTCTSLIHRLGRRMPRTTRELLDITSNHADGKEAVAAMLNTPRERGSKSRTMARGHPRALNKRRTRTASVVAMTTLSRWWCARRRVQRATRASSHQPGTTSRSSWMHCAHTKVPVKHTLRECRLM